MIKRVFDILLSVKGLIIFLPIEILISLFNSGDHGSVLLKQRRVGFNQQPFNLYKYRSMTLNRISSDGSFEPGDQSRVTNFEKILRKTKLDEIPQLINVLKCDMSLVWPRPEVRKWVVIYPQQWQLNLTVKLGITDNTAILYRNEDNILARSANPEMYYKEFILSQ